MVQSFQGSFQGGGGRILVDDPQGRFVHGSREQRGHRSTSLLFDSRRRECFAEKFLGVRGVQVSPFLPAHDRRGVDQQDASGGGLGDGLQEGV